MVRGLIILSILYCQFCIYNVLLAQDLDTPVSIDVKEQPLKEVLNQISAQSGVHFSYSTQLIDTETRITYSAVDKPVRKVLDEVLDSKNISWNEVEEHIVLTPIKAEITFKEPWPKLYTLSGNVRDKINGEALIAVNVYVPGTQYGAITNNWVFTKR